MGKIRKKVLLREYEALVALDEQEPVTERQLQERGRRMEDILYRLLDLEKLSPTRAVRSDGEEIDIFFTHGHRHFLLEARWRKRSTAADIFAFRGKLEGKLTGTLGIFLNVGGPLSQEALRAVAWGRQINCIVFDREDLRYALQPQNSFRWLLDLKLQLAASKGEVYKPLGAIFDKGVAKP